MQTLGFQLTYFINFKTKIDAKHFLLNHTYKNLANSIY